MLAFGTASSSSTPPTGTWDGRFPTFPEADELTLTRARLERQAAESEAVHDRLRTLYDLRLVRHGELEEATARRREREGLWDGEAARRELGERLRVAREELTRIETALSAVAEAEKQVKHYNLDAVLAVGYRVRSPRGTQFRKWTPSQLSLLDSSDDLVRAVDLIRVVDRSGNVSG